MYYNISKFPSDVSKLFKPRPPLQYKRPVGYPPEERRTNPNITGSSHLLGAQLKGYLEQFPEGSENKHLNEYEKAMNSKIKELQSLDDKLRTWEPHNDPNIKHTDPYKTVFVGRLPYELTEVQLQKEFNKFGEIEKVRVVRDKTTNKSKGYAFVVFKNPHSSKMVCKEIGVHRGMEICGRRCIVDIERGRTVKYFKPRRLGGGLGGRGYTKKNRSYNYPVAPIDKLNKRTEAERDRTFNQNAFPSRPVYNGPSRFSRSLPERSSGSPFYPNRFESSIGQGTAPPQMKTSYRSRNSRAQESNQVNKRDEPDY